MIQSKTLMNYSIVLNQMTQRVQMNGKVTLDMWLCRLADHPHTQTHLVLVIIAAL